MIILTAAHNYDADAVKPFFQSLKASGYSGRVAVMGNNCGAVKWLKARGAEILPDPRGPYMVISNRHLAYKEFLRGVDEPVILADSRDVIFQKNPEDHMPTEGVNVYQEYEGVSPKTWQDGEPAPGLKLRIGTCYYNGSWMRAVFGGKKVGSKIVGGELKWGDMPIICAGVTSGRLMEYCVAMWESLVTLPVHVIDQALHNHLIYSGRIPATITANEEGPVYTVGYIPPGHLEVDENGFVRNQAGEIPCIVHQYDRHPELRIGAKWL